MDIVLAAAVFGLIILVLLIFTYVLRYAEFKSELQYLKAEIKRSDPGSGNQKYWRKKYRQLVKEFWLFFWRINKTTKTYCFVNKTAGLFFAVKNVSFYSFKIKPLHFLKNMI